MTDAEGNSNSTGPSVGAVEWCTAGAKIVDVCDQGDTFLEEEIGKIYKDKKVFKGFSHPVTVSPAYVITPYTPLRSDEEEANVTLKPGELINVQLGAQIDGLPTVVGNSFFVNDKGNPIVQGERADLLTAAYTALELFLRLIAPTACLSEANHGQIIEPYTPARVEKLMSRLAKLYGCSIVENTTSWQFKRNEIEGEKRIILAAADGVKSEGKPELGEVWGVEVALTLGSGKVKQWPGRATLMRKSDTTYGLKRQSSKATLTDIHKRFGGFPFSLRQLGNERAAKTGVIESIRAGILRVYELVGDRDGKDIARLFTTVAFTKNGIIRLTTPTPLNRHNVQSSINLTDDELVKILSVETMTDKKRSKSKISAAPAA